MRPLIKPFYVLENKGVKIVFIGELVHVAAVQFPQPSVTIIWYPGRQSNDLWRPVLAMKHVVTGRLCNILV